MTTKGDTMTDTIRGDHELTAAAYAKEVEEQ